jgi:hypothetical protein|tara:strand:+ start:81 stop:293 length:213 start_codon:yes stop_codon:yes gene_type:complete
VENTGKWRIQEFGGYRNLEDKGIWRVKEFGEYLGIWRISRNRSSEKIGEILEFAERKTISEEGISACFVQ